jgi:hypothetical protein
MKIFKNEIENTQKDISLQDLFNMNFEHKAITYLYEFLFDEFFISFNFF